MYYPALNPRFALSDLERCSPEWSIPARSLNQNHERSLALRKTLEVCLCVLTLILLVSRNAAAQSNSKTDGVGDPMFRTESSVTMVPATSKTVPHWTSSFTYQGVTYPFTMVGTDPATSNSETIVDVAIIPFDFVFEDGASLDAGGKVANVLESPNPSTRRTPVAPRNSVTRYSAQNFGRTCRLQARTGIRSSLPLLRFIPPR